MFTEIYLITGVLNSVCHNSFSPVRYPAPVPVFLLTRSQGWQVGQALCANVCCRRSPPVHNSTVATIQLFCLFLGHYCASFTRWLAMLMGPPNCWTFLRAWICQLSNLFSLLRPINECPKALRSKVRNSISCKCVLIGFGLKLLQILENKMWSGDQGDEGQSDTLGNWFLCARATLLTKSSFHKG